MQDKLKTLDDIELQICRRKETKDSLSEECFCVEDFKKELRQAAREWYNHYDHEQEIEGLRCRTENRKYALDQAYGKKMFIKHFFNLED